MRLPSAVSSAVPSLAAGAAAMGYAQARELLARTGFGPTEAEVESCAAHTREAAVARLLDEARAEALTPPPAWTGEFIPPPRLKLLSEEEKKAFRKDLIEKSLELREWWYREMLTTPSLLTERMTLFWHNHFVSSQQKVRSPVLMYRQNALLRRHALGNFGQLLHAVARDSAMVIYLDSVSNRKGRPNENFARELMELFALGEGHYTEQDVREAARAFTGWSLERGTGEFRFYPRAHDAGVKTVLGRTGPFDGDDVLNILLDQPQTAVFVTKKLWREFISPTPDPAEVEKLAGIFRRSGYDIRALLRAMFASDAFYAPQNRAVLVKSPVELAIGALRQFDVHPSNLRPVVVAARALGQDVFAPPNVKGWPGGNAWINSNTLLGRKQLLARLFRAREMPLGAGQEDGGAGRRAGPRMAARMRGDYYFDADRWFAQFPGDRGQQRAQAVQLVLAAPPVERAKVATDDLEYVRSLVLDPVYELK